MSDKLTEISLTLIYIVVLVNLSVQQISNDPIVEKRRAHEARLIDDQKLWPLVEELTNVKYVNSTLDSILIPRVVGTDGHHKVNLFIKDAFQELGWHVDTDSFKDNVPKYGELEFENIIVSWNPDAERFLTLACHYDTKLMDDVYFVGATDSAVPCAILISLAKILTKYLKKSGNSDVSLQLVFFDGEEAFVNWSATDSIYGARHLAAKWEKEDFLKRIDMLVLLDLLGAADPHFYNYFKETHKWYSHLVGVERRLNSIGAIEQIVHSIAVSKQPSTSYFQPYSFKAHIEDDHIPFLKRNVPILHMIPTPFPDCWHEASDDRDAVDFSAVRNLSMIVGTFVAEYLHLDIV